jgi:O-acetyl-ADP-ribose deacetylase (regulator of RNase III)
MLEQFWLVHPQEAMCGAFARRFANLRGVRIFRGRFEDLPPHDCFVTAGNAFGIMTAGIDAAVVHRFGESLMQRVQDRVLNDYFGEQPVGTALVIATGDEAIPFVCHAPTMRVPGPIDGTDKVYCATWAALLAIQAHNVAAEQHIAIAAFPAMGAGFGGTKWRGRWPPPGVTFWIRLTVLIGILLPGDNWRFVMTERNKW